MTRRDKENGMGGDISCTVILVAERRVGKLFSRIQRLNFGFALFS